MQYTAHSYAVAQLEYLNEEAKGMKYTPTFVVYKRGRKVDSFYGGTPQQLEDHLWLHADC